MMRQPGILVPRDTGDTANLKLDLDKSQSQIATFMHR